MSKAQKLADAIVKSANARETSFDLDKAEAEREKGLMADFESCYELTLQQACEQEAGKLATPVYLLLVNSWNDAMEWANAQ